MNKISKFLLLVFVFLPGLVKSQDLLVFRIGRELNCKISKIDSANIYYTFQKDNRTIASFVQKNEIRSYQIYSATDAPKDSVNSSKSVEHELVILDTSLYVKNISKWVNLVTFSKKYGVHATGWSLQYYGYILKTNANWMIPCVFSFEGFTINPSYFSQFNYQSAKLNYWMVGICPFRRLNDYLFLNLGLQLIIGEEELTGFGGNQSTNTIFGIAPSQGIYFIPKSKVGITLGIGLYEKLLTSKIYQNDYGIKFEVGIKF